MSNGTHKLSIAIIFWLEIVRRYCTAKAPYICSAKMSVFLCLILLFNVSLTNDVVSFEQPGPGRYIQSSDGSYLNRKKYKDWRLEPF